MMFQREQVLPNEIEVTPAMIWAGVVAAANYDEYFERSEEGVERIFRAMWEASRPLKKSADAYRQRAQVAR